MTAESKEALNSSVYQEDLEDVEEAATPESVDELRERLERMKKLMADRSRSDADKPRRRKNAPDVIDGNFLSVMFALTLFIISVVSIYAFYNLFWAIWKRNARPHEEL